VKRALLKRRLRRIVAEATAVVDEPEMHRCMNGKSVRMDSPKCVKDIECRIDDARVDRDACPGRTDAREHYNGLLKVLRRKLRRTIKLQPESHI
jgi:hypothetical protein